jgi:hypothetical protein
MPLPTGVVGLPVEAETVMSESRQSELADGLGLGDGLADPLAEGAGGLAPSVGSPSGEGDNVRPKLGDGLGDCADGSSLDPKAACSSHHPNHSTTSRPTMTAARRRQ